MMIRQFQKLLLTLCGAAALFLAAGTAPAANTFAAVNGPGEETPHAPSLVRICGTVTKLSDGRLMMTRQDGDMAGQDIILTVSDETRILDAVNGCPTPLDQLTDGEFVYAYIGPAMALSLPPIGNTEMILCGIPADYQVPEYITVEKLTVNSDGKTGTIMADNGVTYQVPENCNILPYLTRNIVRLQNLAKGRSCLIWTESGTDTAVKIAAFPPYYTDEEEEQRLEPFGWALEDGTWYYYEKDGSVHKGWLSDGGSWYYLDPETGAMKTGFLTADGKTYYLKEDGRMLEEARTFTPDENGALH